MKRPAKQSQNAKREKLVTSFLRNSEMANSSQRLWQSLRTATQRFQVDWGEYRCFKRVKNMRRANSYRMGEIKRNFLFCVFREGEPAWVFLAKPKGNQSDEMGMITTTCAFYLCVSCKEVLVLILYFSMKKKKELPMNRKRPTCI